MRAVMTHVSSLVAGAVVSRLFDSERGRRRRAMLRDKVVSAGHTVADAAETTARDVRNRTRGTIASLRSRWRAETPDDRVLAERVRARLGGVGTHPGAIEVDARDGVVMLCGPVLEADVAAVVRAVAAVPGVGAVDDQLDVHAAPGDVPGLQGAGARRRGGQRFELLQRQWSPTARLLTGAAGAVAALWGLPRGSIAGSITGSAGLALVARAASNLEFARLFGIGAGRSAVTVQKTIDVAAPLEDVWDLWSRYEQFPRFMSHVRSVQRAADGTSNWTVAGPAGVPVTWRTVETRRVPHESLAWKTIKGAPVAHSGVVQLTPILGGTRVHVRMHYTPPAGAIGHALAAMLGADPKRAMDEDLVRMKSLLEDGATTARGETVRRDAIR